MSAEAQQFKIAVLGTPIFVERVNKLSVLRKVTGKIAHFSPSFANTLTFSC